MTEFQDRDWHDNGDGSISYRNRIAARARAHREAKVQGHALGPFTGQGDGSNFYATCGHCRRVVRNEILTFRLIAPPGFFEQPCASFRR